MKPKTEQLVVALGNSEKARWAASESERLERLARKFGYVPQKTECRLSPPLGTIQERLRFRSKTL